MDTKQEPSANIIEDLYIAYQLREASMRTRRATLIALAFGFGLGAGIHPLLGITAGALTWLLLMVLR